MISIYGEIRAISHFGTKCNVIVIMRNTVFNPPLLMVFIQMISVISFVNYYWDYSCYQRR